MRGRSLLLIDDVCTTTATLAACAAFLPGAIAGGLLTFGSLAALGEVLHGAGGRLAYLFAGESRKNVLQIEERALPEQFELGAEDVAIAEAQVRAADHQRTFITPMDLLITLLTASNSIVADCFERIGVTAAKLTEQAVLAEQQAGQDG